MFDILSLAGSGSGEVKERSDIQIIPTYKTNSRDCVWDTVLRSHKALERTGECEWKAEVGMVGVVTVVGVGSTPWQDVRKAVLSGLAKGLSDD